MTKHFSIEEKKLLCKEFIDSKKLKKEFIANKGIGASSLGRWLRELGYKDSENSTLKLQPVNFTKTNTAIPIQVMLPNGTKVNIPPGFCADSLKLILSACGGKQGNA